MKSTRRRSDFTRRQANFTLHSNISPTRRVDFVEKSTSEEVLFSGAGGGTRFARLRALGRSRSQQSTGLLLCAARPSSPTHAFRINKKGTADAIPFLLVPVVGLEPTRCRHQRILSYLLHTEYKRTQPPMEVVDGHQKALNY